MASAADLSKSARHPVDDYAVENLFCEVIDAAGVSAGQAEGLMARIRAAPFDGLKQRIKDAERELHDLGVTFTVYTEKDAIDRILPFDVIPRLITASDWHTIETGIQQRVTAINLFLWDIYHEQHILNDGTLPRGLVLGNDSYRKDMQGIDVPAGTYVHVSGTDIIRDASGKLLVLEDNARTPSGVSYVIENRNLMQRAFPDLMAGSRIRPVSDYGERLHAKMVAVAPVDIDDPQVVLLSPGIFNSAYFEHVFLAREMGVPLVEGRDLFVEDDHVLMKTISGLKPVHVIYRRIDDDFIDPEVFRADSMLGVAGLMRAQAAGNVTLANAVGTGIADDKAIYAYMPRIIRYYLDEDPILENVETHICAEAMGLNHTLNNLENFVVKPVDGSGGYGIVIGPKSSKEELDKCRALLNDDPSKYISQPMISLSVCPTICGETIEPRHVDLRPFALTGRETWVMPGGLTRVALKRGSIVVNSSQGGGTKDTWVLGGLNS